ncbi:hypothetical protein FQR65_LT20174 [Abscondita terminalis]|nr:hypothetical protein FQR65_LT20174 [Abscondita terminalis]
MSEVVVTNVANFLNENSIQHDSYIPGIGHTAKYDSFKTRERQYQIIGKRTSTTLNTKATEQMTLQLLDKNQAVGGTNGFTVAELSKLVEYYKVKRTETKADYANGVSQARENHLTVYSTGGFQVKVNSAGSALENQNGAGANGHIQANTIQIVPSAGSSAINGAQYTSQSLANEQKTIVSSTTGGVDKTFNIQYKGAGAETYLNYYVARIQNHGIYY